MTKTIRASEIRCQLLAILLSQGVEVARAESLSKLQAAALDRKHRGDRYYWAKGRVKTGLDELQRRDIFLEWFECGQAGRTGEGILPERNISATTLERIIREGRRKKWGALR